MKTTFLLPFLALCACGSSSDTTETPIAKLPVPGNPLFFGTEDDGSANGLGFATPASQLEDVEGAGQFTTRLVRFKTDWASEATTLLVSDETISIEDLAASDLVITIDGETLAFLSGNGPDTPSVDIPWRTGLRDRGAVSGYYNIFTYAAVDDAAIEGAFDTEGFFAVGFETDPEQVSALSGTVGYFGTSDAWGRGLNAAGDVVTSLVRMSSDITIMADFDALVIDGTLKGTLKEGEQSGGTFVPSDVPETAFQMVFDADIQGNGYASELTCTSGCSDSASNIGGVFYGEDTLETTGVIGFDILNENGEQIIGVGGYVATQGEP